MDPSIANVDYVIGEHRIDKNDLTPCEWLAIVNAVIGRNRTFAKYLPCIRDHGKELNSKIVDLAGDVAVPGGEPKKIRYCGAPALSATTRLLPMEAAEISAWVDDARTVKYLLLTTKLEWVLLTARMVHDSKNSQGKGFTWSEEFIFELIDEVRLLSFPDLSWWPMLRAFQNLVDRAIYEKQEHLKTLRTAASDLKAVLGRVRI